MKAIIVTAAAIVFLAVAFEPQDLDALPSTCAFRILTHRPCIFCGMSHAVGFAVRGDLAHARAAHPAWFLVLPLFLAFVGGIATKQPRLTWVVVIVLIAGTLVRALG